MQALFAQQHHLRVRRGLLSLFGLNTLLRFLTVQVLALDAHNFVHALVEVLTRQKIFDEAHALHEADALGAAPDERTRLVTTVPIRYLF